MDAVDYALAELKRGVREVPGRNRHDARILEYHQSTSLKATDDETPWCAAFVNWCLLQAWETGTGLANARGFMQWGEGVAKPRFGDVVVFWREAPTSWKGHVGFYLDRSGESVLCLGGNQGNRVSIKPYPESRVLGFRKPA